MKLLIILLAFTIVLIGANCFVRAMKYPAFITWKWYIYAIPSTLMVSAAIVFWLEFLKRLLM